MIYKSKALKTIKKHFVFLLFLLYLSCIIELIINERNSSNKTHKGDSAMVHLITGPKGSGKTQQMIELANNAVKTTNGNVVLIKKSHKETLSVDFNIRAICMTDYTSIKKSDEFIGFLYGMLAGNTDIESIFIDSILKQADITIDNLPSFISALKTLAATHKVHIYVSVSAKQEELTNVDFTDCEVLS